jgi:CHAD domain-containing protein
MPDTPGGGAISLFAANAILDRVDPLSREIEGVIAAKDPEPLHRMRVASRRLRMALRLCGARTWLSDGRGFNKLIRSVTSSLGAARDIDVQIAWLEEFAQRVNHRERHGVNRAALRLAQRREKLQPQISNLLSGLTDSVCFRKTVDELRAIRLDAEMSGGAGASGDIERSTRVLLLHLDSVLTHSASLLSSEARDAHHRLRIEIKHLRYAMEIFRDLYGEAIGEHISLAKKIQGMLGDLHDADVWIEGIPQMREAEMRRTARYFGAQGHFGRLSPGYDAIVRDRSEFRGAQFDIIANLWRETLDADGWGDLRAALLTAYRERV